VKTDDDVWMKGTFESFI